MKVNERISRVKAHVKGERLISPPLPALRLDDF